MKACRSIGRKVQFFNLSGIEIQSVSAYRTSNIKFYSVRALKCYLNEKNLIHGRVTATISKFRLHGRLTARENYTAASSIFRKLYLRVFDFLTFILQGPQFRKNYTLGLSKIGLFLYFRVRGKAQHSDPPPRHFLLDVPPGFKTLCYKSSCDVFGEFESCYECSFRKRSNILPYLAFNMNYNVTTE